MHVTLVCVSIVIKDGCSGGLAKKKKHTEGLWRHNPWEWNITIRENQQILIKYESI